MFVVFAATDLDQRCLELKDLGIKRLVYVFLADILAGRKSWLLLHQRSVAKIKVKMYLTAKVCFVNNLM